jgi:serine/threonine protein kinase
MNGTPDRIADHSAFNIGPESKAGREPSIEIGRVLRDRYVLEKRLGSGGKGTVFKALDRYRADLPEAQQYVAIKILHAAINDDSRERLLAKLRREFYCVQMLSHRNIVNVFELDRDGDVDFFTMEFIDGELLSSVMARLHPLPLSRPQAWAIIREIGAGLEHAHARNVVHTDLKPHNIMITRSGEVRILDFGASSASARESPEDPPPPRHAVSTVTPAYACCELLEGRPPDPRDDIYALACLSYELLAGTHPFQRRRSTEARDLGIVPKRPAELSRRQWRALVMGLSWHRAGRSIATRAWLKKLNTERVALEQLPRSYDLQAAPTYPRPGAPSFRATALFVVLLITVTFAVLVTRLAPNGQRGSGAVVSAKDARPTENPVAAPMAVQAAPQEAAAAVNASPATQPPQSPVANDMSRDVSHSKLPPELPNPILVTANSYKVRSGEHFAEIRVHRSARLGTDRRFIWWTEAATAKPGVDYVPQEKAMQSFPMGKSSTSFFVKLVPNASRAQREVFYVAIAEARHNTSSAGQVTTRAAIWLPPNDEHSAAVAAQNDMSTAGSTDGAAGSVKPMSRPTGAD